MIATFLSGPLAMFLVAAHAALDPSDYFKITVVDEETRRGVPLVEIKTTSEVRYYTDSNGIVAFYEPGLMDEVVYFHIKSHGYEFPQDGFGYRGKALKVTKGGSAILKIKRLNIAERLYRITGEGIYRDSILVSAPVPIKHPALNGQVMGQDGVLVMPYRGKLYWFWGDTNKPSYPLGNFGTSGATSEWPGRGGLNPSVGIDLTYFVDDTGFSKQMCPPSAIPGPGPKWINGLTTIRDEKGTERLIAKYERIKDLGQAYERGLIIFNDKTETFERLVRFNLEAPLYLDGHPFRATVGGQDHYYFSFSVPYALRVRADMKHVTDPASYEAFTCLVAGSRYEKAAPKLDRGPDGRLIYAWRANTQPIGYDQQRELIAAGKMKPEEGWLQLQDVKAGAPIKPHAGSVFWNDFRRRWVMILEEDKGLSDNGELWFAEADTPVGPWVYARKIVTHNKYTFYNPTQHPFFDQDEGRLIYFEGTYSDFFSGSPEKTPRYDYNQIMYRLALDDPRLFLPVPVYRVKSVDGAVRYLTREGVESEDDWDRIEEVAFFALPPDRRREGLIPIYARIEGRRHPPARTLFYGLPAVPEAPTDTPAGTWNCKLKALDGELPFTLELKLEGEEVKGTAGQGVIPKGRFKEGKLELTVKEDDTTYSLTGSLKQGRLAGEWRQIKSDESGTWEGERTESIGQQFYSPAVVPLYEYRDVERGSQVYSTDSKLRDNTLKRSAEPVCRVWRNPMSVLILDRKAKPVPVMAAPGF